MYKGLTNLVAGATYPLRAYGVLRQNPSLWGSIVIPLFINMVVGTILYASLLWTGMHAIDNAMRNLPGWVEVFAVLLRLLLIISLLVVIGFILLRFGVVLGGPWYSNLSEQLEQLQTGKKPTTESLTFATIVRDIWEALSFELKKLLLFVSIGGPLLLLYLIPGIGTTLATIGSIALTSLILCLDFFDAALSRRHLRFGEKLRIIRKTFPASATFGLVCLVLMSIPVANLLAIPICVTAGTLFFCDRVLGVLIEAES